MKKYSAILYKLTENARVKWILISGIDKAMCYVVNVGETLYIIAKTTHAITTIIPCSHIPFIVASHCVYIIT